MYLEPEVNLDGLIPGNNGTGRKIVNHKMKEGDNIFRILPPFGTNHNGLLYADVTLHWFMDPTGRKRPLVCSRDAERYCPVCAEASELYNRKQALVKEFADDQGRVNFKALPREISEKYKAINEDYNKLRGQRGFYYNALDLSGTVGVLKLSKNTAEKLGTKVKEALQKYGIKCTSLADGILFNIKKTKTGPRDMDVEYDVDYFMTPKKKEDGSISLEFQRGSVSDNIKENFETLAYDLHTMYPARTSVELKRALTGDKSVWDEMDAKRNAAPSNGNGKAVQAAPSAPAPSPVHVPLGVEPVTLIKAAPAPAPKVEAAVAAPAFTTATPIVAVSTPLPVVPTTNSAEEEQVRKLKQELGIED